MVSYYNKLLETIILPAGDLVLGTSYLSELKKWRRLQWLSEQQLKEIQSNKLKTLLKHASNNIDYYKNLHITPSADSMEWLSCFPIIKKPELKKNLDKFISGNSKKLIKQVSSGSSGIQGAVYLDAKELSITRAIQTLWMEWSGYKIGGPLIQTGNWRQLFFHSNLGNVYMCR